MKNTSSFLKWSIWSLAAIFYFYEFILRVSPSVMIPELMKSFGITASAVGVLSAFYLYAYAPMQLPVGLIMDRYGIKKVLSVASLICGFGAIFFGIAQTLPLASIGRLMIGAGSSFAFIAMVYVTSYWFDAKKRAFLIGIANSLAMLGASAGTGPLSMTMRALGWRTTIILFGTVGIFLGIAVYFIFQADKKDKKIEQSTEKIKGHLLHNLKTVITKKNNWTNSLTALFFYITTTAFGGLWGISFLQTAYGIRKETAGYAISMIFMGWLVGGPLIGLWSDYIAKRIFAIRTGIFGTFICLVTVIYCPFIHIYLVYVLLFLVGLFSAAELLNFSVAVELNSLVSRATAAAFTNFIISCGDAIVQPLIGFFLDMNWTGKIVEGIRMYTAHDYQIALACLPIGLLLAFFLLFFVREKESL
ncbi:MAG: MFS transporter [Parachlamydiales bacterium]|nr:MFS transporter [Parachlamydiales bacterium]